MLNNPEELENILNWIETANRQQLQEIMDSVQDRYAQILPDWDILYLAMPKTDSAERQHLIRNVLQTLCN